MKPITRVNTLHFLNTWTTDAVFIFSKLDALWLKLKTICPRIDPSGRKCILFNNPHRPYSKKHDLSFRGCDTYGVEIIKLVIYLIRVLFRK